MLQVTTTQGARVSSKLSDQQDDIAAAMQLCNQAGHGKWSQRCRSLHSSPKQRTRQHKPWPESMLQQSGVNSKTAQPGDVQYISDMHAMYRDMQQLDAELADLDTGFTTASWLQP